MIFLNAAALIGIAAVVAPLLIHLFVQRRARPFPFPTLRFLRPTRLAAVRRHVVDDWALLLVRCAIVAVAAAAAAGPLFLTASRRERWSARLVRAVVVDQPSGNAAAPPRPDIPAAFRSQEIRAATIRDGIHDAVRWLASAPPASREILIVSPFAIGSLEADDVAAVPSDIGLRFERRGVLPAARAMPFGRVLTAGGVAERTLKLDGVTTSVEERAIAEAPRLAIDFVAPQTARAALDAAVAAVLAERVWAPAPGRQARLAVTDAAAAAPPHATAVRAAWMADALAAIARDADLHAAAERLPSGWRDPQFSAAPWNTVARAGDGRAIVSGAADGEVLTIATGAPAVDMATAVLVRAVANALADVPDIAGAEVAAIGDGRLRAWSRPAAPSAAERLRHVDEDDRRWLWLLVLALLAAEVWLRRGRRNTAEAREVRHVA